MARCFAFPQPGYVWNGETGDALVMSLKIRREKIAEDKKRKEEKRKSRREKRKRKQVIEELEEGEIREEMHSHKHKKCKQILKATNCRMNEELKSDSSEASNVSKEHGQAMHCDSLSNADSGKGKLIITSAANEPVTAPEFSSRASSLQDMNVERQWEKLISALPFFQILPPEPDDQEWLFRKKFPRPHTSTMPPPLCPPPFWGASLVL